MINKYLGTLKTVELFSGMETEELEKVLTCIGAKIKTITKKDIVLLAGDRPRHIGVVMEGQLHIVREDYSGNRSLVTVLVAGDIFAESLCYADVPESPVTVIAETDAVIMLIEFSRILRICSSVCVFHSKLIENLLSIIANKNLFLQNRMEIISLKSVREKVMRYLESFVPEQGRNITIPLNREKLADFLCVERSALSHELSRMKKDNIIDYNKNNFVLKTI